ncbi:hypothetical protein [Rhizobium leguminosarum]|uniref:hypothetical protein n=1 Tax=Rhizobium TaxID=379 RepID=UPI001C91577A|nr:hypothetical protein [Rhizobium leguminosarum]MBY2987491.1 hypothetical protein [Rhizobium leguminosarum]
MRSRHACTTAEDNVGFKRLTHAPVLFDESVLSVAGALDKAFQRGGRILISLAESLEGRIVRPEELKLATQRRQPQHQLQKSAVGGISGGVHGEQAFLSVRRHAMKRDAPRSILAPVNRKNRECYCNIRTVVPAFRIYGNRYSLWP